MKFWLSLLLVCALLQCAFSVPRHGKLTKGRATSVVLGQHHQPTGGVKLGQGTLVKDKKEKVHGIYTKKSFKYPKREKAHTSHGNVKTGKYVKKGKLSVAPRHYQNKPMGQGVVRQIRA